MAYRNNNSRTLLQRRSNISNILQQLIDGAAVIGASYALITHHLGGVYSAYINFIFVQLVVTLPLNTYLTYQETPNAKLAIRQP